MRQAYRQQARQIRRTQQKGRHYGRKRYDGGRNGLPQPQIRVQRSACNLHWFYNRARRRSSLHRSFRRIPNSVRRMPDALRRTRLRNRRGLPNLRRMRNPLQHHLRRLSYGQPNRRQTRRSSLFHDGCAYAPPTSVRSSVLSRSSGCGNQVYRRTHGRKVELGRFCEELQDLQRSKRFVRHVA